MGSLPPPDDFVSNYPRGQHAGMDYVRPPNVYFDSIGIAFRMLNAKLKVYLVGTLICVAVVGGGGFASLMASSGISDQRQPTGGWIIALSVVVGLVGALVSCVLLSGFICIGARQAIGQEISFADFFSPLRRPQRTLGAVLLYSVPMFIFTLAAAGFGSALSDPRQPAPFSTALLGLGSLGVVLAVLISYLFLLGPLSLGLAAATIGDMPVLEAYKEAFRRLKAKSFLLSVLFILSAMASIAGGALCFVIVLFTVPVFPIVIALHYTYYFPVDAYETSSP